MQMMNMMKNDKIIVCDTREKKNIKIIEYFEKNYPNFIISKLDAGDYMFYKDYSTIIDKKDELLELAHNFCNTKEHERIKREIQKAKQLGCINFIFLIQDNKIKTIEDIKNWSSPHTKVKGETLLKIMKTMKEKYKIRFVVCQKKDMGEYIIKLLRGKNNEK